MQQTMVVICRFHDLMAMRIGEKSEYGILIREGIKKEQNMVT